MNIDFSKAEVINARDRFRVAPRLEPAVDKEVSQIVGRRIFAQDPRLLKLIVKWKKNKPENSMDPDNFFKDRQKVTELREVLGQSL